MPERPPANRTRIGLALLASAAVFLGAALLIASGTFAVPAQTRTIATVALSGTAFVDAILALKFLLSGSSSQ
jgi:hypothetical protein